MTTLSILVRMEKRSKTLLHENKVEFVSNEGMLN